MDQHQRPPESALSPILKGPSPSHAEWARTLLTQEQFGLLSTLSEGGHPYGSLAHYALDAAGCPLLLFSDLAEHTMNLKRDPRSSLLVFESGTGDPLARGRATLMGETFQVADEEREQVKETYLKRVPEARPYADFRDFQFHRLKPRSLRYIGGFGRMSWVEGEDYLAAAADPILPLRNGILQHMNEDHANAMVDFCRHFAGLDDVQSATMTAVDRYGFEMRAVTPAGKRLVRLPFPQPVGNGDEVRKAMVAMVHEARQQ